MALKVYEEANLQAIADAIREKNGETTLYKPSEMASAIKAIEAGGGSSTPKHTVTLYYTEGKSSELIYSQEIAEGQFVKLDVSEFFTYQSGYYYELADIILYGNGFIGFSSHGDNTLSNSYTKGGYLAIGVIDCDIIASICAEESL